jgi:hypothetical protein
LILTSFGRTVFIFPADLNLSKLSFNILFPFSPRLTLVSPLLTLVSPLLTLVEEGSPLLRSDPRPASCCPPPPSGVGGRNRPAVRSARHATPPPPPLG